MLCVFFQTICKNIFFQQILASLFTSPFHFKYEIILSLKRVLIFYLRKVCHDTFLSADVAIDHRSGGTRPVNISVSKARGAGMQGRDVIGRAPDSLYFSPSDWKGCAVTRCETTAGE